MRIEAAVALDATVEAPTAPERPAECMDLALFALKSHNGIITICNPATGRHKTFRISTVRSGKLEGQRIVKLLSSPTLETIGRWQGFGFVRDDGTIALWRKYRDTELAQYPKLLERPQVFQAKGLQYLVEGQCKRCNRRLTHPLSIARGLGDECAARA